MKTTKILATITIFSALLCAFASRAADITATSSGNWGDPTIWSTGTVPGTNDDADVPEGINVTVTTNAAVQYIYDAGTVTMAANATLNVVGDSTGANGTQQLGELNASATGNTVIYSGNAFWAKHQNYYNLVLDGYGTLYNGEIGQDEYGDGQVPMTISGNMTVAGTASVQEADDFTIKGNLIMGGIGSSNVTWDCSITNLTVIGNTIIGNGAKITDYDGAAGNDTFNNLTINPGGTLYLLDSTNWFVNGSLTNNGGSLSGVAYASINFDGTGNITGTTNLNLPTMVINGTYTIGTSIYLNTNTPGLNGTLVFDLANPQEITLATNAGSGPTFYYNGNLDVINSGASPVSGANYQFFNAQSYAGSFNFTTLPSLPGDLSWVNNLETGGSIAVIGPAGSPTLTLTRNGTQLTLSWDSTTYPRYEVQAQTNAAGIGRVWTDAGSGTISPYTITINPTGPPVFFRLSNP